MTAAAPWTVLELNPERVLAELTRRFPGVCAWRGEYTGSWWAVVRDRYGRDRLIEAASPAELGRRLEELGRWRGVPRYARTPAPPRPRPAPSRPPRGPARQTPPKRRSLLRRMLGL
ncbi:hypothetical protein [Spirillospora sp. NPDC029432]|uniref:hypothetical protein n=1 Tax=Spirillospora sp. NPDC029432 TaxID=3154599 RepID=UPI003453F30A